MGKEKGACGERIKKRQQKKIICSTGQVECVANIRDTNQNSVFENYIRTSAGWFAVFYIICGFAVQLSAVVPECLIFLIVLLTTLQTIVSCFTCIWALIGSEAHVLEGLLESNGRKQYLWSIHCVLLVQSRVLPSL